MKLVLPIRSGSLCRYLEVCFPRFFIISQKAAATQCRFAPVIKQIIAVKQIDRPMDPVRRTALLVTHGYDDLRLIPLQIDGLYLHRDSLTGTALFNRYKPVCQCGRNKFHHTVESRTVFRTDRQRQENTQQCGCRHRCGARRPETFPFLCCIHGFCTGCIQRF